MNYLIYIIISIILFLFLYLHKKEQLQLKSYGKLESVPIEVLYDLGYKQNRSKRFSKKIRDRFLSLVSVNSIKPGDRCYPEFKNLCRGSLNSKKDPCIKHKGKYICAAGEDGVNEMGVLKYPNLFGNYNNGDNYYYPVKLKGCTNLENLKAPKKYRCNTLTDRFDYYNPQPIPSMYIPKINISRISFQPPFPLEKSVQDNCKNAFDEEDKYIEQFEDNYANFCKNTITDKICALEPNKRNGKPFCKNVICPNGYTQSSNDVNICESIKDNRSCVLESMNKESKINLNNLDEDKDDDEDENEESNKYDKYPICGGLNYFLNINNIGIKHGNTIPINKKKKYNAIECKYKCLENDDCQAYTINRQKNQCTLYKKPILKKNIVEHPDKVLHYKLPLNYKFDENKKIVLDDIIKYDDKTYIECAEECDKDPECAAFNVNKNKNATNCELKRRIIKTGPNKNIKEDKTKRVFEKITKTDNLCPLIKLDELEKKIDKNFDNINEYFQSELHYYIEKTKNNVSQDNIELKEKITNEFILQLLEQDSIIVWDNINIECEKIRIQKMDKNILHISILQVLSLNENNKIYDLIQEKQTNIKMSSELDNHKSNNLKNKDIFSYASTNIGSNENMQYIDINLKKKIKIYKIILYNRINNYGNEDNSYDFSNKLFPFKIILYNKGKIIETAIKRKQNGSLNIVSSIDKIKDNVKKIINENNICENSKNLNYNINTGFSYNNVMYLIKNSKLINKNIIKYVNIDGNTLKKKYKLPILLTSIWKLKNKTFLSKIDSCIVIDKFVIFTNGKKYTKFNIQLKEELDGYPKKIKEHWKKLPSFFNKDIDCIIPIKNNMCLIYKNNKYIHYPINLIENNNINDIQKFSIFITGFKYNLENEFTNFPKINWDTVISTDYYIYIFKNDIMYRYNKFNKTSKKIKMSYQYKNLWKINVNKI